MCGLQPGAGRPLSRGANRVRACTTPASASRQQPGNRHLCTAKPALAHSLPAGAPPRCCPRLSRACVLCQQVALDAVQQSDCAVHAGREHAVVVVAHCRVAIGRIGNWAGVTGAGTCSALRQTSAGIGAGQAPAPACTQRPGNHTSHQGAVAWLLSHLTAQQASAGMLAFDAGHRVVKLIREQAAHAHVKAAHAAVHAASQDLRAAPGQACGCQ